MKNINKIRFHLILSIFVQSTKISKFQFIEICQFFQKKILIKLIDLYLKILLLNIVDERI